MQKIDLRQISIVLGAVFISITTILAVSTLLEQGYWAALVIAVTLTNLLWLIISGVAHTTFAFGGILAKTLVVGAGTGSMLLLVWAVPQLMASVATHPP